MTIHGWPFHKCNQLLASSKQGINEMIIVQEEVIVLQEITSTSLVRRLPALSVTPGFLERGLKKI